MRRALLLGCGSSRDRKISLNESEPYTFDGYDLVTVDMDPDCNPTHVCMLPDELPENIGTFDEIHAYDSLEHWGKQGDWKGWLDEMGLYHGLLNDKGRFYCMVPVNEDRFTDPGHVRFFGPNWFLILCNEWYEMQKSKGVHVGDYRWYWKKDFRPLLVQYIGSPAHHLIVALEKTETRPA